MRADLSERIFVVVQRNGVPSGQGPEAEPVGTDERAALFNQLDKAAVVAFRADHHDTGPGFGRLRFPIPDLFERLLQNGDQQILRADIGGQCQNVELVSGNARVLLFAEVSDFPDEFADMVMDPDRLPDGRVRGVNSIVFLKRLQNVVRTLFDQQSDAVVIPFQGYFHKFNRKVLVPFSHGLEQLHVLHAAVDHGTAVGRNHTVRKVETALNGAFQQCAAGLTEETGHVVCCNVHASGVWRRQTDRKRIAQIQQGLRNIFADAGNADPAVTFGFLDQFIVGLLQEVFQVAKMFEISHILFSALPKA